MERVPYSLNAPALLAYACHCHDCQTRSGAAFTLTLVIRTADLSVFGEIEPRRRSTRAGRNVEHGFCPGCGVSVISRAPVAPDFMSLRAGTLDDAGWVSPIAQTFTASAIPWAIIPGVRSMRCDEFDYAALGREWLTTAPEFRAGQAPSDEVSGSR